MVANGKVGIFVGVLEVVGAVLTVDADHWRHQQRIDKAVGDAGRIGRRVEHLLFGGGQSLLHGASVGGVHAKAQSLAQLPLGIGVEVVALESRVEHNSVLIGIVG